MEVEEDEAQILTHHYDNIPDIFANLNVGTYSSEEHLGDYHKSVEELAEEESELVEGLCANGKESGEATEELINIGVVSYESKLYWVNDKARLNFELKTVSFCEDTVVPDDVLKLIN
jgi:methionine synthase II (cobalamin-independent)